MKERWARGRRIAVWLVVGVLATAGAVAAAPAVTGSGAEYRAVFPRTVGLYVGSQVSVLGIKVGDPVNISTIP